MEELATAIVDGASLIKQLFSSAAGAEGNIVAIDEATLWETMSTIVQNIAAFMTQLFGEIVTKL